ncbi:MAG TPA: hypothetical protein VEW42_05175 [Candidatus Eisenbacteria bacterium]|nr:hypothetical protein [Candidatus Eisenbacteria bacterium]
MDLPAQQPPLPADARRVDTVEQIERQVDGIPGPQILSETPVKDKSMVVNLLAALGILIVGAVAVVFLLFIPFGGKKIANNSTITTTTMQVGSLPNVVVETEYVNPFAPSSQYTNPFIATKNPFTAFAQQ